MTPLQWTHAGLLAPCFGLSVTLPLCHEAKPQATACHFSSVPPSFPFAPNTNPFTLDVDLLVRHTHMVGKTKLGTAT